VRRRGNTAYRKYIPPGAFAKRVDIRVSLKLYSISNVHPNGTVDLIDYETYEAAESDVPLSSLVTVKAPVWNGPPILNQNLKKEIALWAPKVPTPKEVSEAFPVTEAIVHAIDKKSNLKSILDEPVDNNPVRVSSRSKKNPERFI
jgi:hypothetical protein